MKKMIAIIALIAILVGCNDFNKNFHEIFLGSNTVNKITIRNDSNGKSITVNDDATLKQILEKLDVKLRKTNTQKPFTGSMYSITFFEKDKELVSVTLSGSKISSNKTVGYYQSATDISEIITNLVKEKNWIELLLQ